MTPLMIVKLATVLSIVLLLFGLALRAKIADLGYLVREWRLGLGAFVAMFVCVPVAAFLLARFLDLQQPVAIALIAMALSPLPPILPGKQLKAGGEAGYVTGLMFGASLLSLVVAPLGVWVAAHLFDVDVSVAPSALVRPLLISVFAPIALGLLAAPLLGKSVPRVSEICTRAGTILLLLVVLAFLVLLGPPMWKLVGDGTLLVFAAVAIVGLIAGTLLGGPNPGDRSALALAASARHPGVALAIAVHTMPDVPLMPAAVVLSLIVSIVLSFPYLRMVGRKQGDGRGAAATPPS